MEKSQLEPERYKYLSKEDSELYDQALEASIEAGKACLIIVKMLEDKAKDCRAVHRAQKY